MSGPPYEPGRKYGSMKPPRAGLDKFLQNASVRTVFKNVTTSLRRRCVPLAVVLSDDPDRAPSAYAWVLDRSEGSLCVSADAPRKRGTRLSLRATNAPDTAPWVEVLVTDCRRDGRRWDLDCTFVETRLHNLLLFG